MPMPVESQYVLNAFSLCSKEIPPHVELRADRLWPPLTIPSTSSSFGNRVYRDVDTHWSNWENPPRRVSQISESCFRVRRWAQSRLGLPVLTAGSSETLTTFSTLDPVLYTPTKEKPYQGIWVGDYSAHGCEFLLFFQRDHESVAASQVTSDPTATNRDIIEQGSLEAVKLTGDHNIPRGEFSFIASDIGPDGFIRMADEEPFKGARIVRSRGHIAGLGFRDGMSHPYSFFIAFRFVFSLVVIYVKWPCHINVLID